jgi:hypothetical protein
MTSSNIADTMLARELSLLHRDFSRDSETLEQMLAPDFREISPAGALVTRQDVIRWILNKHAADRWTLTDFRVEADSGSTVLLSYHARRSGPEHAGSKGARHCSLWRFNAGLQCWQLAFHQSTKVS